MPSEIITGYVEIDGLRAYKASPAAAAGDRPTTGMLVLPMVTGIGEQVREWADTIARSTGNVAVAWDTWHGRSSDDTGFDELRVLSQQLEDDVALKEQDRLLRHMREELGLTSIGVVGWCLGGRYALILGGRNTDLANVIAFHPTVTMGETAEAVDAVAHAGMIEAPVFMAYPGKDSIVPRESFLALQQALQSRHQAPSIIQLYPEAKHGFSDKRRHNEAVNESAYRLSWPQALEFMKATTGHPGPGAE